jgi:hypothetical protein
MPSQRWHCPLLALLRQPGAGWLLLTTAYLTAAVLSVFLAVSMSVWWPLVLVVGSLVAAGGCLMAALHADGGSTSQPARD